MTDNEEISPFGPITGQSDVPAQLHVQAPITLRDEGQDLPLTEHPLPNAESESTALKKDLLPVNIQKCKMDPKIIPEPPEQRIGYSIGNRCSQISNVAVAGHDDVIEELPAAGSPAQSPSNVPKANEMEESRLKRFLRKRYEIFRNQLKKAAIFYTILLIFNVALSVVCFTTKGDFKDVCYSFIAVSCICALSTLLFKRESCSKLKQKIVEGRLCPLCCVRYEIKFLSKQSHYVSSTEPNTNFEHEVADTSYINSKDLPRVLHRHKGNLETRSSENPAESHVAVKVDVHRNIQSSSYFSEGACGSNRLEY